MKYILPFALYRTLMAFAPADADAGVAEAPATDAAPATVGRSSFTKEQITEIRALRAEQHPEGHPKAGSAVWSHKALADKFDTLPGTISQIVRNRTHKDPNYVPVNDGK